MRRHLLAALAMGLLLSVSPAQAATSTTFQVAASKPGPPPKPTPTPANMCYSDGHEYHTLSCPLVKRGSAKMSEADAKKAGLKRCGRCH